MRFLEKFFEVLTLWIFFFIFLGTFAYLFYTLANA